ncbi:MAG: hypothetical protein JWM19_957 [Actinomycetia bacterium]|nr:hypothetical protein [Actinomycetes bacterium]
MMSSQERKAHATVMAITRALWCDLAWAKSLVSDLESALEKAYGGTALTPDVIPGILAMAEQVIPAPAGYRWAVEEDCGNLFPYLQPADEMPEGYRFAARVTAGFDGGNHEVQGDLWSCKACGSVILPGDRELHDKRDAEIRSLLESGNMRAEAAPADPGGN